MGGQRPMRRIPTSSKRRAQLYVMYAAGLLLLMCQTAFAMSLQDAMNYKFFPSQVLNGAFKVSTFDSHAETRAEDIRNKLIKAQETITVLMREITDMETIVGADAPTLQQKEQMIQAILLSFRRTSQVADINENECMSMNINAAFADKLVAIFNNTKKLGKSAKSKITSYGANGKGIRNETMKPTIIQCKSGGLLIKWSFDFKNNKTTSLEYTCNSRDNTVTYYYEDGNGKTTPYASTKLTTDFYKKIKECIEADSQDTLSESIIPMLKEEILAIDEFKWTAKPNYGARRRRLQQRLCNQALPTKQ